MYARTPLITVALLLAGSVAADDCFCDDNVCLYEPIRSQLTSTTNADSLLLAFFTTIPFYGSVKISTSVNLTVHFQIVNFTETNSYGMMWTHFWYPYSSTGVLRKLFPSIFRGAMDPWSALPVVAEVVSNDYFVMLNLTLNLSCVSTSAPDPPNPYIPENLNALYSSILQWGKSFGRTNGPVVYGDDADRGIVYDATDLSSTDRLAYITFVLLYVVFNIAVAMILVTATPIALKSFLKQIQEKSNIKSYMKSLFWSSVITGALYIISYVIAKAVLYTGRNAIRVLAKDANVLDFIDNFTIISLIVPLFLLGVHMITAICTSKVIPSHAIIPKQLQRVMHRFCCQKCSHILWAFSLWILLAWLQLIAASFIPVVVSILTDTFRSLAVFGLMFTTIACIVVCSAVLIQTCKEDQPVPKIFLFLSIGSCVLCCLTVGIFTAYFLILSQEGLDADTVAGYVLSVIPTLVLAALAYCAESILVTGSDTVKSSMGNTKSAINEDNSVDS